MVLSPQDIHDKEFTVKMRGYSIDEVNDFLDQIIKDYQITLKQNNDLRTSLNETQAQLKHYDSLKDSLNQSIIVAQEAADRVKKDSQTQSDKLLSDSHQKAKQIMLDADQQAQHKIENANLTVDKLLVESQELKKRTAAFRTKLQSMLKSQMEFTKNSTWDDLLKDDDQEVKQIQQQVLNNLDNQQLSRVKSKSNSSNNSLDKVVTFYPSNSSDKVVTFYPDRSSSKN